MKVVCVIFWFRKETHFTNTLTEKAEWISRRHLENLEGVFLCATSPACADVFQHIRGAERGVWMRLRLLNLVVKLKACRQGRHNYQPHPPHSHQTPTLPTPIPFPVVITSWCSRVNVVATGRLRYCWNNPYDWNRNIARAPMQNAIQISFRKTPGDSTSLLRPWAVVYPANSCNNLLIGLWFRLFGFPFTLSSQLSRLLTSFSASASILSVGRGIEIC